MLGLAGAPAALTVATSPLAADPPRADLFGRRDAPRFELPTPEEGIRRWYTQDCEITHTFDLQIAFHQLAEAEMKRLPPAMELPEPAVRRALLADPNVRAVRTASPRYVIDVYDNANRPLAESHVHVSPVAAALPAVYIGGHSLPARILATARRAVTDLVASQLRVSDKTAFTCPRAVIDFRGGYMLSFFFYSQRLQAVPPGQPHTAVYEREQR